jgi:putative protease
MKVLVPLNNTEHLDDYILAGASEFYIGFFDKEWEDKFGDFNDINRMSGFREIANNCDFNMVLGAIEEIKQKNKLLYITFNSSIYSMEQLDYIEKYFKILKDKKVDGVIVSTIELVYLANRVGIPSVISTIAGVYNSDITRFYKEHGAKRIILPRDLSIDEINQIIKENKDMEFEVFMMRNGCSFSDSHCLGLHRKEICSICSGLKKSEHKLIMKDNSFDTINSMELNNMLYSSHFHEHACGLCSIYQFVKMNITACKIVGRYDEWREVCNDVTLVSKNIEIANQSSSEEEYLDNMIFPSNRSTMCKLGLSCYYPEVRF